MAVQLIYQRPFRGLFLFKHTFVLKLCSEGSVCVTNRWKKSHPVLVTDVFLLLSGEPAQLRRVV